MKMENIFNKLIQQQNNFSNNFKSEDDVNSMHKICNKYVDKGFEISGYYEHGDYQLHLILRKPTVIHLSYLFEIEVKNITGGMTVSTEKLHISRDTLQNLEDLLSFNWEEKFMSLHEKYNERNKLDESVVVESFFGNVERICTNLISRGDRLPYYIADMKPSVITKESFLVSELKRRLGVDCVFNLDTLVVTDFISINRSEY